MKYAPLVLMTTFLSYAAVAPNSYKELKFPTSNWQAPSPKDFRVELSSGTPAYLIPDRSLPVIRLHVLFRGPGFGADSTRLAARELLGSMLVQGGTKQLSGAALSDSLEFVAAKMSANPGNQSSTLTLECLSKDFPQLLELLKQSIQNPGFDPQVLSVKIRNAVESVKHRFDRPSAISTELYKQVLYGKHPSNWDARVSELEKVSVADLQREIKSAFDPGQMLIGVSGDFDPKEMTKMLSKWVSNWSSVEKRHDVAPLLKPSLNPGLFVINHEATQTQVHIAAPFVQRPSADYYPMALAAYILGGGGFGSRLVDRIRTDEGLAYHVGVSAGNSYFQVPTVDISLQTKAPSTARALEITWEELARY